MSTMDALESNTLRHSYWEGAGVDLAEFGKLRCLDAGGDGVGSEARPSLVPVSMFIAVNERLVPTLTEAIAHRIRGPKLFRGVNSMKHSMALQLAATSVLAKHVTAASPAFLRG
jgi:hypothetical protein